MAELIRANDKPFTEGIAGRPANIETVSPAGTGIAREFATENPRATDVVRPERDWANGPAITADQQDSAIAASTPLFSDSDIGDLRSRWTNVQAEFVDEPRRAVEGADQLVATVMQRLADGFAKERGSLEEQWDKGEAASTEDLRMALQRYRAFFNRLLNAA
jgi:hypothetical protein